jgi:hypothetical protein
MRSGSDGLWASRQLANAEPVGAENEVDPIFSGAAPAAELPGIAAGSDLRVAAQPKWPAATITTYGHAKSALLVLRGDEEELRSGWTAAANVEFTRRFRTR